LELVDTAGMDEFKSVLETSIKSRNGYMFVYDTNNLDSLKNIEAFIFGIKWMKTDLNNKVPLLIVGNKFSD
jgi:GTPase SAR1 family protein